VIEDGGILRIKQQDQILTKLFFSKAEFGEIVKARSSNLHDYFERALQFVTSTSPGPDHTSELPKWCESFLKLKIDLMMSPMDYRIHFIRPGTPFDSSWMDVEDEACFGIPVAHCVGKTVKLCKFPALVQQSPRALQTDAPTEDALVKNKLFFPSAEEKRTASGLVNDNTRVIAKAIVLLEGLGVGPYQ
jgi:hypothetical protein